MQDALSREVYYYNKCCLLVCSTIYFLVCVPNFQSVHVHSTRNSDLRLVGAMFVDTTALLIGI
ncbi:hypothetical protein Lal_00011910 [Lupinus albus]|nr:hypothetical protein Lal_00011910 [Lupinus albus]